jgi:predicted nuclease of restriction endonuclease-like (RecB) superfamily
VLTQISWTNQPEILSGTKHAEEKIFYLMLSAKENYSKRELQRQLKAALFERSMLSDKKCRSRRHTFRKAFSEINVFLNFSICRLNISKTI